MIQEKQNVDFEKISAKLAAKEGPITLDMLPDIKIDLRGMMRYAKEHGISVPEMSADEKMLFVIQ